MNRNTLGCLAVALLCASGTAGAGDYIALSDVSMALERTACFGECPIYRVEVRGDGSVVYEGKQYVALAGRHEATIPIDQVISLVNAFLKARFFDALADYDDIVVASLEPDHSLGLYTGHMSDAPSTILEFELGERSKRVRLYQNYPIELEQLADLIDEVTGSDLRSGRKH
jgi:Domain of unknown function (DUF6438)